MRTWKWMITASLLAAMSCDGSADGSSFIITRNITRSSGQPIFSAAGSGTARRNAACQHYCHTRHFSPGRFQRPPTTIDQVVDRSSAREHASIRFCRSHPSG